MIVHNLQLVQSPFHIVWWSGHRFAWKQIPTPSTTNTAMERKPNRSFSQIKLNYKLFYFLKKIQFYIYFDFEQKLKGKWNSDRLLKNPKIVIITYHFFDHDKSGTQFSVDKKSFQKPQIHHQHRQRKHASCNSKLLRKMEVAYAQGRYK